jgi:serine/threonine protein kinase
MEFVEGETLDSFIKRSGPLEVPLALEIVSQVASALDAAYKQHIVHRDIKSSNLMLFKKPLSSIGRSKFGIGGNSSPWPCYRRRAKSPWS